MREKNRKYPLLRGYMAVHGYTQQSLADALGISVTTVNVKMNSTRSRFSTKQIERICRVLKIPLKDVGPIFFGGGGEGLGKRAKEGEPAPVRETAN